MNNTLPLSATFVRASQVLARVYSGASLAESANLDPAVQDLCYGSLRDYGYSEALLAPLLQKPLGDAQVRALLVCALREIQRARVADFTIVNEAVSACVMLGHPAAKGLVNGVLRNFLRQRVAIEELAMRDEVARWRHPKWWIDRVKQSYPQKWEAILSAGNQHPPMCLRVNRRRASRNAYAEALTQAGIPTSPYGDQALLLATPKPVAQIPGFAEGEVSVQDAAAQYAAVLLDVRDGMRVLDACAAPGGKSAHILELADVDLFAIDRDANRAARIVNNLERLGLSAMLRVADAAAVESWWDGKSFDRILLDVPCSASGVVRRHPDIKWLRRTEDIGRFRAQQKALLEALWRVLAQGGKLLYVTCSVFPEENVLQVESFLSRHPDARRLTLPAAFPADGQLLPDAQHDGFYYAVLEKKEAI